MINVIVQVRGRNGADVSEHAAAEWIEAILSRELDHHGDEWAEMLDAAFFVPALNKADREPYFYPPDE